MAQWHLGRTFVAVEHGLETGRLSLDSVFRGRQRIIQDSLDEQSRRRQIGKGFKAELWDSVCDIGRE